LLGCLEALLSHKRGVVVPTSLSGGVQPEPDGTTSPNRLISHCPVPLPGLRMDYLGLAAGDYGPRVSQVDARCPPHQPMIDEASLGALRSGAMATANGHQHETHHPQYHRPPSEQRGPPPPLQPHPQLQHQPQPQQQQQQHQSPPPDVRGNYIGPPDCAYECMMLTSRRGCCHRRSRDHRPRHHRSSSLSTRTQSRPSNRSSSPPRRSSCRCSCREGRSPISRRGISRASLVAAGTRPPRPRSKVSCHVHTRSIRNQGGASPPLPLSTAQACTGRPRVTSGRPPSRAAG
jgi:hypothetical protein